MRINNNVKALCTLLRAGLWEQAGANHNIDVNLNDKVDWEVVYQLASEQSVLGIVLAGIDCLPNKQRPNKELLLQWIGEIQMLEQQNKDMNQFIGRLVEGMRSSDIYTLLVKGQGVAQCYDRPLWRSCGDVDLLLSNDNYQKAKQFLMPLSTYVDPENIRDLHQAMTIDSWLVELHGKMPTDISGRINAGIDEVLDDIFYRGEVRSWDNDGVQVFLPSADNDVIIIFTHFLQHFYVGGVGLRQICDWCRLLWTYRSELDLRLLESRIKQMGLMSEWKAFASLAAEYLGMPKEAMPFFVSSRKNSRRANKLMNLILETGNLGHNIDYSYRSTQPYLVQKSITLWHRMGGFMRRATIFPLQATKYFFYYVSRQTKASL